MDLNRTKILGTGKYHPAQIKTNLDIAKTVDTSDEWIVQRTGIKERRIGDISKDEGPSGMAARAAKIAIENAGLEPNDIDLILFSVTFPDTMFPNTASWLQEKLGITNKCGALDINAACTGWVYGLTMANALIQTGTHKHILLVGTEMGSAFVNWEDRNTCVLFGDGSGAVVLGASESTDSSVIIDSILGSDSSKKESLILPKGGAVAPIRQDVLDKNEQWMSMDGQIVFKNAVKTMASHCAKLLKRNKMTMDDIDWFIPHQANLRIIEATGNLLKCPEEKVIINVEKYANTSSASIPAALHEAVEDGRIKRGDTLLFAAFGAGLTSGATLLKF
ncbi:MAG: 3-oxoacyl-ACP synthase [Halobacteriovoraceae bacterium]|nr:3-oxoacyl-ACP synthase [Halobacteriovoraceae bacterium]|tara:strand:+ start:1255 stop:2256 length:1002 start_codon:yes stop_codon:yes gene_type:complete